jgi:hypothetical protein
VPAVYLLRLFRHLGLIAPACLWRIAGGAQFLEVSRSC